MSLWVDKYRPKELSKLDYHTEQAEHLKLLVCNYTYLMQLYIISTFKYISESCITCDWYLY